jgi:hypothetical protein
MLFTLDDSSVESLLVRPLESFSDIPPLEARVLGKDAKFSPSWLTGLMSELRISKYRSDVTSRPVKGTYFNE